MWQMAWTYRLGCASALLLLSLGVQANACIPPSAHSGDQYLRLSTWSKDELSLVLSEYMYVHRWTRHAEAVSAGFRYGDRVYGEALKTGGRFDVSKTATWRHGYATTGRGRFLVDHKPPIDMALVDRAVVRWLVETCLAPRTWSRVIVRDNCRFVFSVGLASDESRTALDHSFAGTVRPVRLEVRGGRCARWPARPLSQKGDAVECVRSGDGAVSLELKTDRAGDARHTLAGLPTLAVASEPAQETKLSEPVTEVVSLWRSRDYRLQQLGRGCPTCALYFADIRPSAAGAVIQRAETVSTSGAGWVRCPAGLRCGVYEFSPEDNARLSGCAGLSVCRVWRLAETDVEGSDVVQLTFQKPETVCVNCPEHTDFETARRQWQALRDQAQPRCAVVADAPAQSIGRKPTAR